MKVKELVKLRTAESDLAIQLFVISILKVNIQDLEKEAHNHVSERLCGSRS